MDDIPSPASRPATDRVKAALIAVAIAAAALAAGIGATWLIITISRLIIDFIHTYAAWILATIVLSVILCAAGAVARASAAREAERRAQHLAEIAHLEHVDTMSGAQFEDLVGELLRRDGYLDVQIVGKSGDRGVDVTARTHDGRRLAVQCKRQSRCVNADRIRNLIGAVHGAYAGHQGVLVTSHGFTKPAADEGRDHIIMIDRESLGEWMRGKELRL